MPEINSSYCLLIFIIPAFTSLLILISGKNMLSREGLALTGMAGTFVISGIVFFKTQKTVLTAFNNQLRMDSLSGLVAALIGLIRLIVIIYSLRYIQNDKTKGVIPEKKVKSFYWQVMLFISTMLWATTTNNIILLWVIIEATTLAATILVAFYWNKKSIEAGYKFILLLTVGISFALFGCVLLYSGTAFHVSQQDPLQITTITAIAKTGVIPKSILLLAAAFLIVGFGTKAGIAPFHAWLPDAHAEAPTPISALLSGVMIKVGAYALVRTITIFYSSLPMISLFMVIIGIFTMILGVLMMVVQEDVKRFLAFSSVSQLGYIIMGFGLAGSLAPASDSVVKTGAYLGMYGALFHLINHGLIKSLLFLCAGAILYRTGIRHINELGGLSKKMPLTGFCFFVAGLSISGIPFLNGFMSKMTLFLAGASTPGMLWTTFVAIGCSVFTLAGYILVSYKIFLGPMSEKVNNIQIREVPASMGVVMAVLCFLCFLLGTYPQIIYPVLDKATHVVLAVIQQGG